jgi:hypothetical protein
VVLGCHKVIDTVNQRYGKIYIEVELIVVLALGFHFKTGESVHFERTYAIPQEKLCELNDNQHHK